MMVPSMFGPEAVGIVRFAVGGEDELGNPVMVELPPEWVDGVLVAVGSFGEPSETNRPDGVTIAYTLLFPDSFVGEVDNCEVYVRGHRCRFVGHSDRFPQSPTPWNMKCEVESAEG